MSERPATRLDRSEEVARHGGGDPSFGEAVSTAVGLALGYASMCWDPAPTGIFDSTRAAQAARELTAFIVERASDLVELRLTEVRGNHTPQRPSERPTDTPTRDVTVPVFPRRLVELVRNELREFSADDPGVGDLLDQDANRILSRLADAGVELPADPEPEAWTPQRAAGEVLGSCDAINSQCDGGVFVHRLRELGWNVVRTEEADTDG